MNDMSDQETSNASADAPIEEPVRRRGDRRVVAQAVSVDRRKADRRDTPGVKALFRTLFKRPSGL